jgi:hypothetical protein
MKQIKFTFIVIGILISVITANAQSVSIGKIFKYLEKQEQTEISKELVKLGFVYKGKMVDYGLTQYKYEKNGTYGLELFSYGFSDELFALSYKLTLNFYPTMKEIVLTNDFVYSYSAKNVKFYENNSMRIGVNDTSKIILFFVNLK